MDSRIDKVWVRRTEDEETGDNREVVSQGRCT